MQDVVDLSRYPLHALESPHGRSLVAHCREELEERGVVNLDGFLLPAAAARAVKRIGPEFERAFLHAREHNIYFRDDVPGLAQDHPALRRFRTVNRTVCADQISDSDVVALYEWRPFREFVAAIMGYSLLHPMDDPLARVNVMAYRQGEALNWHFDRSVFTTTLLLQAPESGGIFEYRPNLRSSADPNYEGVARLLAGLDAETRTIRSAEGDLNVFLGRDTPHRVTPVLGSRERVVAVFSYFERPGVRFSAAERVGFYGRAG